MKKIITLSLISTSLLFAASVTVPNSGTIMQEVQAPANLPKTTTPLVEVGGVQKYAAPMVDDKSGKTLHVSSFKITGALHVDEQKLLNLIASYKNKDLSFNDMQTVAGIITEEYRKEGYLVARAYIPVQSMNNGVLEIAIIEGRYGMLYIKNSSYVKNSLVQGILVEILKEGVITSHGLERSMLLLNDTPGAAITQVDLRPGKEVGTSDIDIDVNESKRYNGYIVADNYGSRYTGYNRVMAGVDLNSLANAGDKLSLSGLISSNSELENGSIYYSLPLLPNGLTAQIGYSKTTYSLAQEYASLDATGKIGSLDASLSYPIIRTQDHTLRFSSTISFKTLTDYQQTQVISNKSENVITFALADILNTSILGYNSQITSGTSLTLGTLTFLDDTSKQQDLAGAKTAGNFHKVNAYVTAMTYLPQEFSLQSGLQVQKALGHKNLDGSEDMSIGGTNGIRLFPVSEQTAENGLVLNLELYKQVGVYNGLVSKVGTFYDVGTASMEDDTYNATFKTKTLQDIGIGYYASYQSLFAKAELAHSVGGAFVTSEPKYTTRALVQVGWSF